MKYAISGSHGHIGSALLTDLLSKGHSVLPISQELLYSPNVLHEYFRVNNPDVIIHCAAYGNNHNQKDIAMTVFANILGTFNMLKESLDVPYKAFVNFSSSSVTLPYETFYSASKKGAEAIATAFFNGYHKPIVTVRPYTIIGKGESQEHLIPKLIESCMKGTMIPFVGYPTHDYVGIRDFITAIYLLIDHIKEVSGSEVSVCSGVKTTNTEIKKIVEKLTGKAAKIAISDNIRPYDSDRWVGNPARLITLGWKKTQTLEDIINEML